MPVILTPTVVLSETNVEPVVSTPVPVTTVLNVPVGAKNADRAVFTAASKPVVGSSMREAITVELTVPRVMLYRFWRVGSVAVPGSKTSEPRPPKIVNNPLISVVPPITTLSSPLPRWALKASLTVESTTWTRSAPPPVESNTRSMVVPFDSRMSSLAFPRDV